jgi:molybdate transport system permease protein
VTASRIAALPAALLLALLALPVLGLVAGTTPTDLVHAAGLASTRAAFWLSLRTTTAAVALTVVLGTPLAWWLSRARGPSARIAALVVELPVVLPPAVLGVALLETFGRRGLLGPLLAWAGLSVSFTPVAVVIAQLVVGAPLYVLAATTAFRGVDDDLLLVARTLGAGPARAFLTIALPAAGPGLVAGAGLAWARALGEFGATLMFAGSLPGRTQTLTLAVYAALERDLAQARALSLVLVLVAAVLLVALRSASARSPA